MSLTRDKETLEYQQQHLYRRALINGARTTPQFLCLSMLMHAHKHTERCIIGEIALPWGPWSQVSHRSSAHFIALYMASTKILSAVMLYNHVIEVKK